MTIGFVIPHWPPAYGGGEQFMDRMIAAIIPRLGCDVKILTTTPASDSPDAYRGVSKIPETNITRVVSDKQHHYAENWIDHFDSWISSFTPDLLIFAAPATYYKSKGDMVRVREVFANVKSRQIPFGFVHYDLSHLVNFEIGEMVKAGFDWLDAKDDYIRRAHEASQDFEDWLAFVNLYEPPSAHDPDFMISCSEWSLHLLDPLSSIPGFTLHPLMDYDSYSEPYSALEQGEFQVGFVNPSLHKGCTTALNLALGDSRSQVWLRGSYGDSNKKRFMDLVNSSIESGNISCHLEIVDYVPDIRSLFASLRSHGLLLFPSHFEGYGMIAVEAMAAGIPVVSTNHPATVEGVGDSAYLVNPFLGFEDWEWALDEVLDDRDAWVQAAADRIRYLKDRQKHEVDALIDFLQRFL